MIHADSIWVKNLELNSDSLQSRVDTLQARLDALQAKSDIMYSVVESSNSGVSNQLSTISLLLEIIAIVIAVGGCILGFYISKKRREIERMANTVDEKKVIVEGLANTVDVKKTEIETLAKTTEDLDKKIHNDIAGLYNNLRKEETKSLFQRLVLEPEDIANLGNLLLARDVSQENFTLLKDAYLKLVENKVTKERLVIEGGRIRINPDYLHSYMLQFFQHFFYLSIIDDCIRPAFVENFKNVFDNAYDSDIIRATDDLCKALTNTEVSFNKEEVLTEFLKAINSSQFKEFIIIREILQKNIRPQTLLDGAIEHCKANNVDLILFGIKSQEGGEVIPPKDNK